MQLLNKVAGIYGLIAVLTGAGGSFAQLSLYLYSVIALVALAWGLKAVNREDPKHTLYFAHLYSLDHIISTSWTIFFFITYYYHTAHDGARQANSEAQLEIIKMTPVYNQTYTEEERTQAAGEIWRKEKGMAIGIIVGSWACKVCHSSSSFRTRTNWICSSILHYCYIPTQHIYGKDRIVLYL